MSKYSIEFLLKKRNEEIEKDSNKKFLGLPDTYYDDPIWFCLNGHKSKIYLKSEPKGAVCLDCNEPVLLVSQDFKI